MEKGTCETHLPVNINRMDPSGSYPRNEPAHTPVKSFLLIHFFDEQKKV
jgi:hypothetical protein